MSFSNSPLVSCTRLSPNHSGQRTHGIDRITPHCVVGQVTAESLGEIFSVSTRQASCNYGIGRDGRVVLVVEEKNRSWCSSNAENDQRAVTIEVASDSTAPYAFREEAYNALIALCVDICRRNGKKKLLWLDDRDSTLAYQPAADEMVLTVHRWFAQKSCPGDWMYARMGELASRVTAALGGNTPASTPEATSAQNSLKEGSKGEAVKTMQIMLNACGFNCGEADGDFGRNTLSALLAFQTVYGLTADGVYSAECRSALESAYAALPNIMETAKAIWDRLYATINNPFGVAGAMGNFWKESNLRANNLQNSAERKLGMSDEEYTAAVDSGAYTAFVTDRAGYGLYQATHEAIKGSMLRFAQQLGRSIGDTDMQVEHFIGLVQREFPTVWKALTTAKTVREASDAAMLNFERPADQSEKAQEERAAFGEMFLKKYAKAAPEKPTPAATGACYASKVIAVAISELGYKEKRSNSSLDDKEANAGSGNFTKYARDFDERWPNWYNGRKQGTSWCDELIDWCFLTAYGYENALRLLCQPERSAGAGCTYSLRYYREKGQFHQYGAKAGDRIFFGTSLDNATHTGLVEKVDGSTVHTIEGNTGDQVARRRYSIYDSAILGYGRPAYDEEESTSAAQEKVQYYRMRKSWQDKSSQIGAFTRLENAKLMVDANPGYAAFDDSGKQIYPPIDNTT